MSDVTGPGAHVPDASPLDELASAIVDGEATAEEQARASEPEVAARIAELEQVARLVGTPGPEVTDERRDATVTAAMAAWGTSDPAAPPDVDELAERRRRQARRFRVVGVAAAVAAVFAIGALALSSGSDDTDETATAALEESAGDDAASEEGGAGGESATQDLAVAHLGEFDDFDQLLTAAGTTARLSTPALSTTAEAAFDESSEAADPDAPAAGGASPPDAARACPAPDRPVLFHATAAVDGEAVVVVVLADGEDQVIQILNPRTCAVLAERAS